MARIGEGQRGLVSQAGALGARRTQSVVPDVARSQSEEAYIRIRDRIVCLDMPPGSVVEEGRLRDELEIGRTPIREALQRLSWENLVRSVPHRGTFVTDVNITDLARITEVRVVLEGHAARLAAERGTATDREAIGDLIERLDQVELTNQRELMRLDQAIHRQIYCSGCGCWGGGGGGAGGGGGGASGGGGAAGDGGRACGGGPGEKRQV